MACRYSASTSKWATNEAGTPTAGKVRVKDGTRVAGSPSGQAYLSPKLVGYMEAKSGRRLVYAVYLNNVPTAPASIFATFLTADRDIGAHHRGNAARLLRSTPLLDRRGSSGISTPWRVGRLSFLRRLAPTSLLPVNRKPH